LTLSDWLFVPCVQRIFCGAEGLTKAKEKRKENHASFITDIPPNKRKEMCNWCLRTHIASPSLQSRRLVTVGIVPTHSKQNGRQRTFGV
jgi:hypothetical protein